LSAEAALCFETAVVCNPPLGDIKPVTQIANKIATLVEGANCVYTKIERGGKWLTVVQQQQRGSARDAITRIHRTRTPIQQQLLTHLQQLKKYYSHRQEKSTKKGV